MYCIYSFLSCFVTIERKEIEEPTPEPTQAPEIILPKKKKKVIAPYDAMKHFNSLKEKGLIDKEAVFSDWAKVQQQFKIDNTPIEIIEN